MTHPHRYPPCAVENARWVVTNPDKVSDLPSIRLKAWCILKSERGQRVNQFVIGRLQRRAVIQ